MLTITKATQVAKVIKLTTATKINNYTSLHHPTVCGAIVDPTAQVSSSAMLLRIARN
jgi:hypothetical protein